MKILLLQDIPKLGRKGNIADVPGGYARNALFPKKLAILASEQIIQKHAAEKIREEKERELKKAAIITLLPKIHEAIFEFHVPAGKNGELFSSLHEDTIKERVWEFCAKENNLIRAQDIRIETKPIKKLGDIKIPVILGRGEEASKTEVSINVLPRE